jgi:hypothetical protein
MKYLIASILLVATACHGQWPNRSGRMGDMSRGKVLDIDFNVEGETPRMDSLPTQVNITYFGSVYSGTGGPDGSAYVSHDAGATYYQNSLGTTADLNASSDLTVMGWFKRNGSLGQLAGLIVGPQAGANGGYMLVGNNSPANTVRMYIDQTGSGTWAIFESTSTIGTNWTHIAGRWDGTNINIWIDGIQEAGSTACSTMNYGGSITTVPATGTYGSTFKYNGALDEIQVYDRPLTSNEIYCAAQMTCKYIEDDPDLMAYWTFNGKTTFADTSGEGNDVTNVIPSSRLSALIVRDGGMDGTDCIELTGSASGQYFECADDDSLSFTDGSDQDLPFSLSFDFNLTESPDAVEVPLAKQVNWFSSGEYYVYLLSGEVRFLLLDNSTQGYIARRCTSWGSLWTDGEDFVNITCTYDGSETVGGMKIYINGEREDDTDLTSGSYIGMENLTGTLQFGREDGTKKIAGDYDNIKFWNRELTAAEAAAIYAEK